MTNWVAISLVATLITIMGCLDVVYLPFVYITSAYNILNKRMDIDDIQIVLRVAVAMLLVLASIVISIYMVMKS